MRARISKYPLMMNCREFEEALLDYLERTMTQKQRFIMNLHLSVCPECRSYLSRYRQGIALGKKVCRYPDDGIPDDVPEDLVRAILSAREEQE